MILFALQVLNAHGQTRYERQEAAGQIIDAELKSIYNSSYSAPFVYEADSLLGYNGYFFNPLDDPYSTLKGCFIFIGGPDTIHENIVGVFKDGHVLWHSDTLNCFPSLKLFTTQDLNNDGTVDLVFECGLEETQLWIFSWDGQLGKRINAIDEDGASVIEGSDFSGSGSFELIDVDGDGVWEINNFRDESGSSGWSWNGQEYGHWANTPNMNTMFPPRNKIDVVVTSRVVKQIDTLEFSYNILNKSTSKQKVVDFSVWCHPPDGGVYTYAPFYWSGGGSCQSGEFIWWGTMTDYTTGHIRVGKSTGGFIIKAKGLCAIYSFSSHGYNGHGSLKKSDFIDNADLITKDDLENAFWGKAIGPANPSNPFIPINFLDTITSYTTQSRTLGWIKDDATANKYLGYFASAKTSLQQNNIASTRTTFQQVLTDVNIDSTVNLTSEAYALIRYNTEYLLAQMPTAPPPGCIVKLVNSTGSLLTSGTLQYRDSTWKDATNNNDGTFTFITTRKKVSLRMTYEYGTQTKSNVLVKNDTTIIFQTKNVAVNLQSSQGVRLDTGIVQYNAVGWHDFGITTSGMASKELLPIKYKFKMTYNDASIEKTQNIDSSAVVLFQTVNAIVQLKNSLGNFIDQGAVQYNAGEWKDFGITTNGSVQKELLPAKYNFKMTYASASKNQAQDLDSNTIVVFQTSNVSVQLKNSQGVPLDTGVVQYNAGGWQDFGITTNGVASKELLANKYNFRMTYAFINNTKSQDIDSSNNISFSTVLCTVRVTNSAGQLVSNSIVTYNAGGYKSFGTTVNGIVTKELLPANITFRVQSGKTKIDRAQDITTNPNVEISLP
jgi:hypothetical protein